MRWFASLRSAKKYCASVGNTAGGYGIRPYVFCFRTPGENSTFFIIYYFLFFILKKKGAQERQSTICSIRTRLRSSRCRYLTRISA